MLQDQDATHTKILSFIWSYRRKRNSVGEILKYKSRICVDGSQQEYGRDYWEVYAPVVSWPTIRLTLLLSTILDLKEMPSGLHASFSLSPTGRSSIHEDSPRLLCVSS
jgi:hypothetical protein